MNDEVLIRMGVDGRPIGPGLAGVVATVGKTGDKIKGQLNDAFKPLIAGFTISGIAGVLNSVMGKVEGISQSAKAVGFSTDFYQDLLNVADAAGIAEKAVTASIDKLARELPEGSNVEESFRAIADQIGSIEDPTERARVAFEKFGKQGQELAKILGEGAKGIEEIGSQLSKFDSTEIRDLLDIDDQMDKLSNRIPHVIGKAVSAVAFGARTFGTIAADPMKYMRRGGLAYAAGDQDVSDSEEQDANTAAERAAQRAAKREKEIDTARAAMSKYARAMEDLKLKSGSAEEKIEILNRRLAEQVKLAEDNSSDFEKFYGHLEKVASLEADLATARKEQSKERQEQLEKEKTTLDKINDTAEKRFSAASDLATAKGERGKFSLGELAGLSVDRFTTRGMRQDIWQARQVQSMEGRARWLASRGRGDQAQALFGEADKLRSGIQSLTESDRAPFAGLEEKAKEQSDALKALLAAAKNEGLKIQPIE